jgi:hypothetical protein
LSNIAVDVVVVVGVDDDEPSKGFLVQCEVIIHAEKLEKQEEWRFSISLYP